MSIVPLILLVAIAVATGGLLILVARWRPGRVALLLAAIVVVVGLGATCVDVANGIAHSRVEFHGKLDVGEIQRGFGTPSRELRALNRGRYGHLSSAQGDVTKPRASTAVLALWSIVQLAPWLLAAIVLALVFPILRAADRGDPFWEGATRRLTAIGLLLLVGIPALALLEFIAAEAANDGLFASPGVEPSLTLSVGQVLPGVLVLALVGIFRRGVELRDLERHTI